jgi:hypothetical protein
MHCCGDSYCYYPELDAIDLPRFCRPVRIINVASAAHLTGRVNFDDLFRDKPGEPSCSGIEQRWSA